MEFRTIDPAHISRNLLLQADPSWQQVSRYLETATAIACLEDPEILGIVLIHHQPGLIPEIVNLSVPKAYQGQGIGKRLLKQAILFSRDNHFRELQIKTANSSIGQLALYQKMGFQMNELDLDYFVREYDEPIWENGIQCRHRVILHMDLS